MRHHETEYDIGSTRVLLRVEYSYVPGSPAVYYQRNGDPGWPAEPAEVYVYKIEWRANEDKKWSEISGPMFELIADDLYDELCDAAEDRDAYDSERAADMLADRRHDQRKEAAE